MLFIYYICYYFYSKMFELQEHCLSDHILNILVKNALLYLKLKKKNPKKTPHL
jgi:hypothetical protein